MTKFIQIYDHWGVLRVLNADNIICVRKFEGEDPDFVGCKSIIEYGSGFMDIVYMTEDVQDFYEKYLKWK